MRLAASAGAALLAAAPIEAAWAQVPPASVPGIVSPEFQRRELQPPVRPRAQPPLPVPAPPALAPAPEEPRRFVLRDIRIEGAAAIPEAELAPLWQPLLGTPVSVADLEDLAARISARYRDAGYFLSQAILPPQRIVDGAVTLRVVEGFLDAVTVEGGRASARATAQRLLGPAQAARPLTLSALERGLLLSRDLLGGTVESTLSPSPTTFGAADLAVQLEPRLFEGFALVDNRASRNLGPWIARTGGTLWNPLGLSERLDAQFAATPGSPEFRYGQGVASVPLPGLGGTWLDGTILQVAFDRSTARPDLQRSGIVGLTTVQRETNVRASLLVPIIRSRPENLAARFSAIWRETTSTGEFLGFPLAEGTDRLIVLEPRLVWDVADAWNGVTLVDAGLRFGLGIAGTTQVAASFPGGPTPNFVLGNGVLSRLQRIGPGPWSVLGEFVWQWTGDALPVSERFALGGERMGRGFAPGNTLGDSGYAGRLELRRTVQFDAPEPLLGAAQFYAFGDWGAAIDVNRLRDGRPFQSLASAGFGARVDVTRWLTLTPEVAFQLAGRPVDTASQQRQTRFLIGAIARF
jgi:hemolysin activation/secretion protein